jgi:hypothetical protein
MSKETEYLKQLIKAQQMITQLSERNQVLKTQALRACELVELAHKEYKKLEAENQVLKKILLKRKYS